MGLYENYFNLAKMLRLFKMAPKQFSGLEQRSVVIFLVAEKCKPYDITEECLCTEKHVLVIKMFANGLNMGLL